MYYKSPKKTQELADVVDNLKEVFQLEDSGDRPHKAAGGLPKSAMLCNASFLSMVPILHISPHGPANRSVTAVDRAQLKGYLQKWQQGTFLLEQVCMWMPSNKLLL